MRHASTRAVAGLALAALLLLAPMGCTQSGEDRLTALEKDVAALKERNAADREELALVRKNLEAIRELLELDRERAAAPEPGSGDAPDEEELDAKAKSFVNENLKRLMDVTKKLLDKMEKELDEQLDKMKEPAPPQGTEI